MAEYAFKGKRKLCYTELADYTGFQGIGHDPLYRRYDSVMGSIASAIAPEYQHFLAAPLYLDREGRICWYIDEWQEHPQRLTTLSGTLRTQYESIKDATIGHYREASSKLSGDSLQILGCALRYIDDDHIYCADGKVFLIAWGMTPNTSLHKEVGTIIHEYEEVKKCLFTFDPSPHGNLHNPAERCSSKPAGSSLAEEEIPSVDADEGWLFDGWSPAPTSTTIDSDITFHALYHQQATAASSLADHPLPPPTYRCTFDAGDHGTLSGNTTLHKIEHSTLSSDEIPPISPNRGYEFTDWEPNPTNCLIDSDKHFTARYRKLPWYRRCWLWLTGPGCLRRLLWLLLGLLALLLLLFLFRSCIGCDGRHEVNGVIPSPTITLPDGRTIDDNGRSHPITDGDGTLPADDRIAAPVVGEDNQFPPIIRQPGQPSTLSGRLLLFMEEDDANIDALAHDFKQAYPSEQYSIIGFDREVKLLAIQVPEEEKEQIRSELPSKLAAHRFIIFDEEVYEITGTPELAVATDAGWHLEAIHLKQGWQITQGSPEVKVAIVDDGIQASHPMFKGRIADAYNIFTQNNTLSLGEGHGTHVAGLAAGSADFYDQGAAGVAPLSTLMPIQVIDNGQCPLSALVAGVMYAIHRDADVVNISIGPSFSGLNELPTSQQAVIAQSQFHHVAALWNRVCRLAAQKNAILVFAAGNDDILASIPPENRNSSSIVVTATDYRRYPTTFTNYGPCADISAPGKDIFSSVPDRTFQSYSGTSMSAPLVTGTIALMKSLRRDLTVEQARNVLYSTGKEVYGYIPPQILVDRALEATQRGDFSRTHKESHSVPPGVDVHLHSGIIPTPEEEAVIIGHGEEVIIVAPGEDAIVVPPSNPGITSPSPTAPSPDYDAIRRLIAEYKRKIEELEQQLPKE